MDTSTFGDHHKKHAEHNEEVYNYLRKNPEYIDWVITAAFYTTIYYVQYKIFPYKMKFAGKTITLNSIEEYHEYSGVQSIHASRKKIVSELLTCRRAYKQLHDLCMTARYNQYEFENPEKLDVKVDKWLKEVKKACL